MLGGEWATAPAARSRWSRSRPWTAAISEPGLHEQLASERRRGGTWIPSVATPSASVVKGNVTDGTGTNRPPNSGRSIRSRPNTCRPGVCADALSLYVDRQQRRVGDLAHPRAGDAEVLRGVSEVATDVVLPHRL